MRDRGAGETATESKFLNIKMLDLGSDVRLFYFGWGLGGSSKVHIVYYSTLIILNSGNNGRVICHVE